MAPGFRGRLVRPHLAPPGGPLTAAWSGREVRLRFRHTATGRYVGRGVYVDVVRVAEPARLLFAEDRPSDAARIVAIGWTRSAD